MTLNLVRRLVTGTPLTAEEHDTNLDKLEDALAPLVRGQISRTTSATISIAEIGTYYTTGTTGTLDAGTANGIVLGTTDTFAVRNSSGATKLLRIYGSIDASAGNNQTLGIKLALNGTPIDATECRAYVTTQAPAKLVTSWMVSVPANGEVALFIANHTATDNISFQRGRIVASEIR